MYLLHAHSDHIGVRFIFFYMSNWIYMGLVIMPFAMPCLAAQGTELAGDRASWRTERIAGCKISGMGIFYGTYAGLRWGISAHREVRPAGPCFTDRQSLSSLLRPNAINTITYDNYAMWLVCF